MVRVCIRKWYFGGLKWLGFFGLFCILGACGSITKKIYQPDELRQAIELRTHGRAKKDLEVPFEIDPKYVEIAKSATRMHSSRQNRAVALSSAMFSMSYFGLRYENVATTTANETLQLGYGNCLALASVFIGLARSIGLDSYYMDVSSRVNDLQRRDDLNVRMGHITAATETEKGIWLLDVRHLFHIVTHYRLMDDLEAVAHFYNNRGYEIIALAQMEKEKVDWEKVIEMFTLATRIKPNFYRAWNNLGVAYVRSGNFEKAEKCYLKAIAEKKFVSPYFNLGLFYLSSRNYKKATKYFEIASNLESDNSQIQYHYGIALLGSGHTQQAQEIFERAIDLNEKNRAARKYLKKINYYQENKTLPTFSQ